MKHKTSVLAMSVVLVVPFAAYANDLACGTSYGFRVDVASAAGQTVCSNSARDLTKSLKNFRLSNQAYTETSAANGYGRINDVALNAQYAANSNDLVVSIPALNIENRVFTGANRDQAEDAFEKWLKKSGVIGQIMNYQAKTSPTSPITGTSGIIPTMASTDFNQEINSLSSIATHSSHSTENNTENETQIEQNSSASHFIGTGVNIHSYSIKGQDERVNAYTLPFSYSFHVGGKPNSQMTLSLPVTMYSVGKAKGYHLGLGAAYRFPITDKWSLTPGVRYAVTGSMDRAAIAGVTSATLTSTYHIPLKKFDLNIGNMVGYYRTSKFKAGDYSFNPRIRQTMLRNGVMLSQPIQIKDHKLAIEYSLIDTRYVGSDKPFMRNMQELGVTLGTHRDHKNQKLSFMRAGVGYMHAKDTKGFNLNFGYWF